MTAGTITPAAAASVARAAVLPVMVTALAMGCSVPTGFDAEATRGDRAPTAVVSQNFVVFRPTSPAAIGDGDFSTDIRDPIVAGGTPTPHTSRLVSDDLAGVPAAGAISYVRIFAAAGLLPGAPFGNYTEARIVWTLGATEDHEVVEMFPFVSTESPHIGGDNFPTELFIRSTGELDEKPGGGAWTWADVLALEGVGVEVDETLGAFLAGGAMLGEVWVEVYGAVGSGPDVIYLKQQLGAIRRVETLKK